ncbi:MAG: transposase [Elusimicrobia bacterium]|nr:transposase [Elusimicrobiota bacterium]
MPRQARIHTPGLLHHVISRGLNRGLIFKSGEDYRDFIERIGPCLEKSPNQILAWALMPNHFHLLVRSGTGGITSFMRRLMSGYANAFNARHKRSGYLFQNRYKSIVCEESAYLMELVRYIHLNPLRAGLVKGLHELRRYPYAGHGVIMGTFRYDWQERDEVLGLFGKTEATATRRYAEFVGEGVSLGRRPDLVGGGLKKSHGGVCSPKSDRECYDSRILGSGSFVESLLSQEEKAERRSRDARRGGWDRLVKAVAQRQGVEPAVLFQKGRRQTVSDGKAMLIYAGVTLFGKTNKKMAAMTRMAEPPASRARQRGKAILEKSGILSELGN